MEIIAVIVFFIITYCLGYSLTRFSKQNQMSFEMLIMNIGVGLSSLLILGVVLNVFNIILSVWLFLGLSLIIPLYDLIRAVSTSWSKEIEIESKFKFVYVLLFIIFLVTIFMYMKGAFGYRWLEDDDPWEHAASVLYISQEKNLNDYHNLFQYLDSYPPGYDLVIGLMHQITKEMMWTLKFFNALIISLGILFFYFFAERFFHSAKKAIFATFILATIPSYMSHFIWSYALLVPCFFVVMWCLLLIEEDRSFMYISIPVLAGMLVIQPSESIKICVMLLIFYVVKSVAERRWNYEILISGALGALLSLFWWATNYKEMFWAASGSKTEQIKTMTIWETIKKAFPYDGGSATREYTFRDFFVATKVNMINCPIGWGIVISLLLVLSFVLMIIFYKKYALKSKPMVWVSIFWFIFCFIGVNTMTFNLPIGLFAFRFWPLLAICVALICGEGMVVFVNGVKKYVPAIIVISFVVAMVIWTSFIPRYQINTSIWSPGWALTEKGVEAAQSNIGGYLWIDKNIAKNTNILGICSRDSSNTLIGYGYNDPFWRNNIHKFKENVFSLDAKELKTSLINNRYEYIVFDSTCLRLNQTIVSNKVEEWGKSGLFSLAFADQKTFLVLKV